MSDFRIASRYAKTIFDLAVERKIEDQIDKDMDLIKSIFDENRSLVLMLRSPVIKDDKKLRIIHRLFEGRTQEITLKFFEILSRKSRLSVLPILTELYKVLYNQHRGIVQARVTLAMQPYPEMEEILSAYVKDITGKQAKLEFETDREIIGGFILNVEDKQLDRSLKGQINRMRAVLTTGKK
ncbi:MAG: ATP synthase F1 subunit delta [Cyclobacteriaceae bacterium]|nr:ATP synthase F1 subunit delta [Cyclobacteriaceae bacterium]